MKKRKATTYTLREKGMVSSSTVGRLKKGESVSTNTIDALCEILKCEPHDVIKFIPSETSPGT
jgi:DNA-binding Xre family transcriptional regulator